MKRRGFLLSAGSAMLVLPAWAETNASSQDLLGFEKVKALSGDRFLLAAQEYLLADITAPSAYRLGQGENFETTPYFLAARARLQSLLEQGDFTLEQVLPDTRWNAKVVHGSMDEAEKDSLQETLVAMGAARVAPQSGDVGFIEHLLVQERLARIAQKGLWALEAYQVYDALGAEGAVGNYHLIEGKVMATKNTRSRFYLNFGEDYHTDFTVTAKSVVQRGWANDGFDLTALENAHIRVRGFVVDINGPSIELTHRQQIEILT